jgi:hypothetical protein
MCSIHDSLSFDGLEWQIKRPMGGRGTSDCWLVVIIPQNLFMKLFLSFLRRSRLFQEGGGETFVLLNFVFVDFMHKTVLIELSDLIIVRRYSMIDLAF